MRTQLYHLFQLALGLAIMYSCFCRLRKTDADTHREIRWAFVFQAMSAGMLLGAPVLPLLMPREVHWEPGTTPTWIWLMFALSVWLVQLVTARHWRDGVPSAFQRGSSPPPNPLGWFAAPVVMLFTAFVTTLHGGAALATEPESKWRPAESDIVLLEPGQELRCHNATGCVAFTTEALRGLLQKAGGTCGRIPKGV